MSLVLIYELTIQVRSLPFLLAWTPQSPLIWHIWDPCGTLFTFWVLLEYEKWEMSRSVWEVVEVKSGLRQPDISAPLQTNDPPHRRKKRWLGQFEWITLKGCLEWFFWDIRNRLKLLDVDIWLKAWYKCQRCGSEKRGRRCATQKLFQPNFVSCYQPHNTWVHHSFIPFSFSVTFSINSTPKALNK